VRAMILCDRTAAINPEPPRKADYAPEGLRL
jgi:hypothetical protein